MCRHFGPVDGRCLRQSDACRGYESMGSALLKVVVIASKLGAARRIAAQRRRLRITMSLQVEVLRKSFQAVAPQINRFVDIFYARLFAQAPELRRLFGQIDLARQKAKLIKALTFVIANADRPERLAPMLNALGRDHSSYGARPEHYPLVVSAMLDALAEVSGKGWTRSIEAAWLQALTAVTKLMLDGARLVQRVA